MLTYELWDTESRNRIGAFDSETEALAAVLEAVTSNGAASVAHFSLLSVTEDDTVRSVAVSAALAALALLSVPVAQLEEQPTPKGQGAGSSPVRHTNREESGHHGS